MILPLTHEHGTVHRIPVITLAVMLLCLLVHLRVNGSDRAMAASEKTFEVALRYYVQRPYLEADPRLAPPELAALLDEWSPDDLEVGQPSALQQSTLDGYTADWLETLKQHPLWTGGLLPAALEIPNLVSYAFLHGGWLHLVGNLLFLYLMGPFVEDHWGRWAYGAFYVAGAVVAGLGFALHYPNLYRPLVGASGAIAAVMGAFLVLHGKAKVKFLYYLGFIAGTFTAPAWLMLPLWLLAQVWSALVTDAALPGGIGGGVAYWAHIWGFAFGLTVALILRATGVERRLRPLALEDEASVPAHVVDPVLARAKQLQLQGRPDEAWRVLAPAARNGAANLPVLQAAWDASLELGRPEEGAPALQRLIQEEVRQGDVQGACSHWYELLDTLPDAPGAARAGIPLAQALAKAGRPRDMEDVLRGAIDDLGPDAPLGLVVRATDLAEDVEDGELRRRTIETALEHPHLPPELREELELRRPLV